MKNVAVGCNAVSWGYFCMMMLTDGPPKGVHILFPLMPFLMPILNVVVIRFLSSPSRVVKLVTLVSNIVWLGLAGWLVMDRYLSHPEEDRLIEFAVYMALTSLLSGVAISLSLRASQPALPK